MFSINWFYIAQQRLLALAHKRRLRGSVLPFGYRGFLWLVFGVMPQRPTLATGLHPITVHLDGREQYLIWLWMTPGFTSLVPGAWSGTYSEISIAWPLSRDSPVEYDADYHKDTSSYVAAHMAALGQLADVNLMEQIWVSGEDEYALHVGRQLNLPKVHDERVNVQKTTRDCHFYARVNDTSEFNMAAFLTHEAMPWQVGIALGSSAVMMPFKPNKFSLISGANITAGHSVASGARVYALDQGKSYLRSSLVSDVTLVSAVKIPDFRAVLTESRAIPIHLPTG